MGGPRTAAAYASSFTARSSNDKRQRLDAAVHSLRKATQFGTNEGDGFLSEDYDNEDEDEDYDDFNEEEVRAAAALEHSEMKKQFNFHLEKRRSLKNHFVSAMHKKRRLLMRNENLRFRELYKAPEPMVLFIAVSLVTIVSLILTKSWPFY